jgi:hypothetical protein
MDAEEITTQLTINQYQADCLLLSLSASIKDTQERERYFNDLATNPISRAQFIKDFDTTEEVLDQKIEEQLALCDSLMDTYPGLFEAIKEIYPELEQRVEESNKIIIAKPSWQGR